MSGRPGDCDGGVLLCETADVFRRNHTSESVATRIDHLMAAVFVSDDEDRLERLSAHVATDFVYISPAAVVDGAQGLSDAFSRYRHDEWRHTTLRRTSDVDLHHAHFRYSWERFENGARAMEGCSFGWTNGEGRIACIVAFDGLLPGQMAHNERNTP
jgi:hypothetical protein